MTDQSGGQQGAHISLQIDGTGLSVDSIDKALSQAYGDPVQSRLLEAARAKLAAEQGSQQAGPAAMMPIHTHYDTHTDVPINVG